jgi:hypothetical protein
VAAWHTSAMTVSCDRHQRELYPDVRDGEPMGRYLCPEPGCTTILAAETLSAVRDQLRRTGTSCTGPWIDA